jgi:peptidoglycan-N-acetylglucosamine deacetylase
VALTFDDGPGEETGTLLETLVRAKVPAAFFLVGAMIRQQKAMARRIAATPGMTIANHTISHPMLTRIPPARARREIVQNSKLIEQVTGVKPRFFRPPYGLHNSAIDAVAGSLGQSVVLWSAGALDWEYDKPAKIVEVTVRQIAPGAIVLAHDVHPWTIKAMPGLIAKLRAKGYTLVSLDDILGRTRPGKTYVRGRH